MKKHTMKLAIGLALAAAAGSVSAAGPLKLCTTCDELKPMKWNTANGPIPVYVDGGEAFTFDYDGTPFITIERANEITQFAFDQWNSVETSTFEAQVMGTIESVTGIADVTSENATQVIYAPNSYGFHVIYDTDGSIIQDVFGVPKQFYLGFAFPEWADPETGEILEASVIMNGWNVYASDTNGEQMAGVFTHEIGHAINLAHTQVNGDIAFASYLANRKAAPRGCSAPTLTEFEQVETMYPTISNGTVLGKAQSTVNVTDDIVAISNLYPTEAYLNDFGSITGVLTLKDGVTPYLGVNVIARNVNDWFYDAVSAMTGDQTQGKVGPDGRFTINGLTPGEEYVLYINETYEKNFSTPSREILSQAEYWNAAESNDPATDDICDATPIVAEAGVTKTADIVFNGYLDGVQYTPIVAGYLMDVAKNGKSSSGLVQNIPFKWTEDKDFFVLPFTGDQVSMNRNGRYMTVMNDFNGNGINNAALVEFVGVNQDYNVIDLGDLNGNTCASYGLDGLKSSNPRGIDAAGHTVVGTAYVDNDGDGRCSSSYKQEIVPFIWTRGEGMRQLPIEGMPKPYAWIRADVVSGNGKVVLGSNGGFDAVAWVEEGPLVNLATGPYAARDAYAVNYMGDTVALNTKSKGPILWNPYENTYTNIGSLEWCTDVNYVNFFVGNLCKPNRYCAEGCTDDFIKNVLGVGPVNIFPQDMNDQGTVIIGRSGSFFGGFVGAMYVEGLGWMTIGDFLRQQGVAEAFDFPMDNLISIDADGNKLVGGLAGAQFSWHVDMSEVFVCVDGEDVSTTFPEGAVQWVNDGAKLGRCAFVD